jgi:hypothetical protein
MQRTQSSVWHMENTVAVIIIVTTIKSVVKILDMNKSWELFTSKLANGTSSFSLRELWESSHLYLLNYSLIVDSS